MQIGTESLLSEVASWKSQSTPSRYWLKRYHVPLFLSVCYPTSATAYSIFEDQRPETQTESNHFFATQGGLRWELWRDDALQRGRGKWSCFVLAQAALKVPLKGMWTSYTSLCLLVMERYAQT